MRNHDVNGMIYFRLPVNLVFYQVQSSMLNQRGWVLQERVLSRRLLSFTKTQVFWECRKRVAGQGGPQPCGDLASLRKSHNARIMMLLRKNHNARNMMLELNDLLKSPGCSSRKASVFFSWRKLVEEFSETKLTYDTDKLYAVLGLANRCDGK